MKGFGWGRTVCLNASITKQLWNTGCLSTGDFPSLVLHDFALPCLGMLCNLESSGFSAPAQRADNSYGWEDLCKVQYINSDDIEQWRLWASMRKTERREVGILSKIEAANLQLIGIRSSNRDGARRDSFLREVLFICTLRTNWLHLWMKFGRSGMGVMHPPKLCLTSWCPSILSAIIFLCINSME